MEIRIYMQLAPGDEAVPRFYQLWLQQDLLSGWTLIREWGPTGSTGRMKREHFETLEAAQNAMMETRDAQLRKGFRVVYTQGARSDDA